MSRRPATPQLLAGSPERSRLRHRCRTIWTTSRASMPDGSRALLDVNVILDVLQRRRPFYDNSAAVLAAAETGRFVGLVAAHGVTTLFYLLAKYGSPERARARELLSALEVAPVDGHELNQVLVAPFAVALWSVWGLPERPTELLTERRAPHHATQKDKLEVVNSWAITVVNY
jgi:hypothetical protein